MAAIGIEHERLSTEQRGEIEPGFRVDQMILCSDHNKYLGLDSLGSILLWFATGYILMDDGFQLCKKVVRIERKDALREVPGIFCSKFVRWMIPSDFSGRA